MNLLELIITRIQFTSINYEIMNLPEISFLTFEKHLE